MKANHQLVCALPVVIVTCTLVSAPSAFAQFKQQTKLVGTGVVGPFASQRASSALSWNGDTALVGGPSDAASGTGLHDSSAAGVGTARMARRHASAHEICVEFV